MTILREAEHKALKGIQLSGKILDLGGDRRSEYLSFFKGDFTLTTANLDKKTQPDILADLEKPLEIPNSSYNGVLLINVLEHIYEFKQLIEESARLLIQGGKVIVVVPYMLPYHPSPNDYFRFSKTALERLLTSAGFSHVQVTALGSGVYSARSLFLERLLPANVQTIFAPVTHTIAKINDAIVTSFANTAHKKYVPSDYALGFLVTAIKE